MIGHARNDGFREAVSDHGTSEIGRLQNGGYCIAAAKTGQSAMRLVSVVRDFEIECLPLTLLGPWERLLVDAEQSATDQRVCTAGGARADRCR